MTVEQLKELWGEDLFDFFADQFTESGWLTIKWGDFIEDDDELKTKIYSKMYLLDLVESDCGKFIKTQI